MAKFKFKKRFGQNFLQNASIAEKIVDSISPTEKDLIIEIGPGAGAITKKLKKYGAKIIAYEIDEEVKKYLDSLEDSRTKIVYEDFLEANIKEELTSTTYEKLYIIGNLPYYITTPIIERIIDLKLEPEEVVIMVQKEVADRFLAKPQTREYGYMTVLLNYSFDLTRVVEVKRVNFKPAPNVDSTVIKLSKKDSPNIDYEKFKSLLKDSFQFKRKTISNNLKGYDLDKVRTVLENHGKSLSSRAEELDLETFIELSKI